MKIHLQNSYQLLPPDQRLLVSETNDVFTAKEIDQLEALALSSCDQLGQVGSAVGPGKVIENFRRSKVHWLNKDKWSWVYDRLWAHVKDVNAKHYGVDVHDLRRPLRVNEKQGSRSLQLSRYDVGQAGHYTWHLDISRNRWVRKLSVVVQLSDPATYGGGKLQAKTGVGTVDMLGRRGTVFVFPSWVLHRVTPVSSGTRCSLVGWYHGPQWR